MDELAVLPDIPIKDVYFFFDEIQRIEGWELFVMRLSKHYSKHIFISGSNADMMMVSWRRWPTWQESLLALRTRSFTGKSIAKEAVRQSKRRLL